jgi:hypothetical protein
MRSQWNEHAPPPPGGSWTTKIPVKISKSCFAFSGFKSLGPLAQSIPREGANVHSIGATEAARIKPARRRDVQGRSAWRVSLSAPQAGSFALNGARNIGQALYSNSIFRSATESPARLSYNETPGPNLLPLSRVLEHNSIAQFLNKFSCKQRIG